MRTLCNHVSSILANNYLCRKECSKLVVIHKTLTQWTPDSTHCSDGVRPEMNAIIVPNDRNDEKTFERGNSITVNDHTLAEPLTAFTDHVWPPHIINKLRHMKYKTPTPVQSQALPVIMAKRDVVAIASSGSGKTLAFVLPAVARTVTAASGHWPQCLVLTPTRELTHQVQKVVKEFRLSRSVCLYGGVSIDVQLMQLRLMNPHILISTVARLNDILDRAVVHLKHVDYVVLDEADLMLSMEYERQLNNVLSALPPNRQMLMFSATWPPAVQSLADKILHNYALIKVDENVENPSLTVNRGIQQIVEICEESEKLELLQSCLNKYVPTVSGFNKTIIFVRKKSMADKIVRFLTKNFMNARALHSGKSQPERDYVTREFKRGTIPIICATDVASRGLDFPNVKLVVNYNYPANIEHYVHRIGRTGRHYTEGTAVTLITPDECDHVSDLVKVLNASDQYVSPKLIELEAKAKNSAEDNLKRLTPEDDD